MSVVVIGGSGLVGTNVVRLFQERGDTVVGTYRSNETATATEQLDKTDKTAVDSIVRAQDPDLVVDTAAFHSVDDCETERDRAWRVNAQGTRNVAVAADAVDAHYVFVSTDYVFPGDPEETPYTEDDRVAPLNYYARTKLAGEQAARIPEKWTVLRGSVIYGLASDNFLTWVLGELDDGNDVDIVDDQVSRPTYAPDLARSCVDIGDQAITGLYHAAGPRSLSRYEFTTLLADRMGLDRSLVSPITTEALGQDAPRPADSSLDATRLYDAIGSEFTAPEAAFEEIRARR